jgi:hypothetical protein
MHPMRKARTFLMLVVLLAVSPLLGRGSFSASMQVEPTEILLNGALISKSSVAAADFDGDGFKEIVVGGCDGILHVASLDGSTWGEVWRRQTNNDINTANPPNPNVNNNITSSPAIADLDGDGHLDIVVTVGGDIHTDIANRRNGGVLVYRHDSSSPWGFSLIEPLSPGGARGWPQPRIDQVGKGAGFSDPDGLWDGITTTPALGDLDGDGDLEIVVAGIDRRIHAWHHDGVVVEGWPISQWNGDLLWRGGLSSPALGDLDDDGLPEVVVGTMSPYENGQQEQNATLWAINGDSTSVPGFPVKTEQILHSSPALGDIDNDDRLEIVIGAGWGTPYRENIVYAWNHDGTPLPNWPRETTGVTMAPPALGDIDGDDEPEIVIGCGNHFDPNSGKKLYAWNTDGSLVPGFPMEPRSPNPWIPGSYPMPYSPVLADFDGDGTVEILVVHVGARGVTFVEPNGTTSDYTSHRFPSALLAPPLVDDLDNDGLLEIVVAGEDPAVHQGLIQIWDESGAATSSVPWPMFHHDAARTGLLPLPPRLAFPSDVRLLHEYGSGDTARRVMWLENERGSEFNWGITHAIARLQVVPASGTVVTSTPVQFAVTTTGLLTNTWHELGRVTVTGTVNGKSIDGSPINSTVYVYTGDIAWVYLPLSVRDY